MLELLKIIVQSVVLERDEDGQIIGERVADPVALFTPEQCGAYVAKLREQIEAVNASQQSDPEPFTDT